VVSISGAALTQQSITPFDHHFQATYLQDFDLTEASADDSLVHSGIGIQIT